MIQWIALYVVPPRERSLAPYDMLAHRAAVNLLPWRSHAVFCHSRSGPPKWGSYHTNNTSKYNINIDTASTQNTTAHTCTAVPIGWNWRDIYQNTQVGAALGIIRHAERIMPPVYSHNIDTTAAYSRSTTAPALSHDVRTLCDATAERT